MRPLLSGGQRADIITHVLARVIEHDPDWQALPTTTLIRES
jgi:hypothetical protein